MELLKEVLADTAALIRREAHPQRGTVGVSPETAERWAALLAGVAAKTGSEPPSRVGESVAAPLETGGDVEAELAALAAEVSQCTKCPLCEGRRQTVFSDGSARAELVFVGEAPGEQEDLQGVPFVGRAGQLLTDIIVKGMKLKRQDVYICNVIKCRPPGNRDPHADEKAACEPYLVRQLALVRPRVLCALGRHAANTLLKTDDSLGRLRNTWHFYQGIPLRVTYHPAYLLRNPGAKKETWHDIQEVMKVLSGEYVPEPPRGAGMF